MGGKKEIEVAVSCEMERNGLRKKYRVSHGEAAGYWTKECWGDAAVVK